MDGYYLKVFNDFFDRWDFFQGVHIEQGSQISRWISQDEAFINNFPHRFENFCDALAVLLLVGYQGKYDQMRIEIVSAPL